MHMGMWTLNMHIMAWTSIMAMPTIQYSLLQNFYGNLRGHQHHPLVYSFGMWNNTALLGSARGNFFLSIFIVKNA